MNTPTLGHVYAVGDIQGCYKPLKELLERMNFNPQVDRLWSVGDAVNRGPDSLAVLRYLHSLGDRCTMVLGNHDLHFLSVAAGAPPGPNDTFLDVLESEEREALIDWLRHRPLLHIEGDWCMVHAGLHPHWDLDEAVERAREVERVLQSNDWKDFCLRFRQSPLPALDPGNQGEERLRFNLAVFTHARLCTPQGRFNWKNRTGLHREGGEMAWYEFPDAHWRGRQRILFGHWAARGLVLDRSDVLGLDSGCVWGGKLSGIRLQDARLYQVACPSCQPIGA